MESFRPLSSRFLLAAFALGFLALAVPGRSQGDAQPPLPAGGAPASAPSAPSAPLSPEQVAVEQQREQIRKQQDILRLMPTLTEAANAEKAGDYAKARPIYLAALAVVTPAPATARVYNQCVAGLLRCNTALIEEARKAGNLPDMETLLASSLVYAPNDPQLKKQMAAVQKARRDPQSVSVYANPALNDAFKKKVETVEDLFAEAEQARRTGQYDLAEQKLNAILALDSSNASAQKKLDQIIKEKTAYQTKATDQTREERLAEVTAKWSNLPQAQTIDMVAPAPTQAMTRSNQFEISQKLKSIVIPSVTFSEANLQNAVDFLNDTTRQLDLPDHAGINFIPRPEALAQAKPITLSLTNVPLGEVLRYITQLAQVNYKVDQSAVFIVPISTATDVLVRRQFNVSPSFFTVSSAAADTSADPNAAPRRRATATASDSRGSGIDAKDQLSQRGVDFSADGSNAVYLQSSGVLQVINTPDQMDMVEELVNASAGQSLMVNIEARFVEINQTDLNDLNFNWSLNPLGMAPGLNTVATTPQFSATTRGLNGLSNNTLDALLAPNGGVIQPNQFLLSGIMDGKIYSVALQGLAQKKSTDLLASPTVRVRSSERATMQATRTFFYPTSYDPPRIITIQVTGAAGATVPPSPPAAVPAFPSAFDKQEIGVTLNVQPTVGGDSRTIDLSLVPEIVDFEGFINYGDPITVSSGIVGDSPHTLVANQILQPVFNIRRITTKIFISDGYTIGIGGLIREDVQTINDKVPFLGDLPFLGRLFQGKTSQNVKRNLLVFVTGRIVRPDGEPFHPDEVASTPGVSSSGSIR